jgi:hypothetical protein
LVVTDHTFSDSVSFQGWNEPTLQGETYGDVKMSGDNIRGRSYRDERNGDVTYGDVSY